MTFLRGSIYVLVAPKTTLLYASTRIYVNSESHLLASLLLSFINIDLIHSHGLHEIDFQHRGEAHAVNLPSKWSNTQQPQQQHGKSGAADYWGPCCFGKLCC
jgi:hypothetical protein